jgi:hypothetical protein
MALSLIAAGADALAAAEVLKKITPVLEVGTVVQVFNRTGTTLLLHVRQFPNPTESGEFAEPPDNTIPPAQVSTFGVKGVLGTNGSVIYGSGDPGLSLGFGVSWEIQHFQDPVGGSYVDGSAAPYFRAATSIGDQKIKCDLTERPTEAGWRRCNNCGRLNHQLDGLDSACAGVDTHDNAGSQAYRVIQGQVLIGGFLWDWRRCRKCACLIQVPNVGACYDGGPHDPEADSYTVVPDPAAPGQQGWQCCGMCSGLVLGGAIRCPSLATQHVIVPVPVFTVRLG